MAAAAVDLNRRDSSREHADATSAPVSEARRAERAVRDSKPNADEDADPPTDVPYDADADAAVRRRAVRKMAWVVINVGYYSILFRPVRLVVLLVDGCLLLRRCPCVSEGGDGFSLSLVSCNFVESVRWCHFNLEHAK